MKPIAIYALTSKLHDPVAVNEMTQDFLSSLGVEHDFFEGDYSTYGTRRLSLIYVRTGGTEGVFLELLPELMRQSRQPFYLLTSGKSNSLAASMEILSYLRQHNLRGEILHGSPEYIRRRVARLEKVNEARETLQKCRLGVIGKPSDWLISSGVDYEVVKRRIGIEITDIPIEELIAATNSAPAEEVSETAPTQAIAAALPGAMQIYSALRTLIAKHKLQGITLRCFDLLTALYNTGCLALARLNAEGLVASCEGDVPAMLSMMTARAITGKSGFQANPATIDPERGVITFAHCTIPLNMVSRYELDTHFESGIGVAIRGFMADGPVTVFKLSPDLSRHFAEEGTLAACETKPDLCRTQMVIKFDDPKAAGYFLTNPIGNHHIIIQGRYKAELEELLATL